MSRPVVSPTVTYTAVSGEPNDVTVTRSGGTIVFTEAPGNGVTLTVPVPPLGDGCSGSGKVVTCTELPGPVPPEIQVDLGDNDDRAALGAVSGAEPVEINGEAGDDVIEGTFDSDTMTGGAGNDTVTYESRGSGQGVRVSLDGVANDGRRTGGTLDEFDNAQTDFENLTGGMGEDELFGNDATSNVINGGPNIDQLWGDSETTTSSTVADTFIGGNDSWRDTVHYDNRTVGINITIDGAANDGQPGENDSISNGIEAVFGGKGPDVMTGSPARDIFEAGDGNDTLEGGLGDDILIGESGLNTFLEGTVPNGADQFNHGVAANQFGFDTIDYSGRTGAVTFVSNSTGGNGEAGENDSWTDDDAIEVVKTGSGNDIIDMKEDTFGSGGRNAFSGAGNDTIVGSIVGNIIDGGAGNDTIDGGPGADDLDGGAGDTGYDRLTGGPGADDIDGGPGIDRALYSDSAAATAITIDNAANDTDGTGSTTENVRDTIESISGSDGAADLLTGSCGNNVLAGQAGNDTLNGDPTTCATYGGDFMGGGAGNDTMLGSVTPTAIDGVDRVTYTANTAAQPTNISLDGVANDTDGTGGTDNVGRDIEYLYGGPEVDTFNACGDDGGTPTAPCTALTPALQGVSFWGGLGDDVFFGSDFNDYMDGQGGADAIDCEGGTGDMKKADAADVPPAGVSCETAVP